MRYLVLSDIHSNIEALDASIRRARDAGYDRALCCGDLVGYGPSPAEVIDALENLKTISIRGNHDRVISGLDEPTHFNVAARKAVEWTRQHLSQDYLRRLAELLCGPLDITENARLVHGSARDEDEYVVTQDDAVVNLALPSPSITFFGHTHEPGVFTRRLVEVGHSFEGFTEVYSGIRAGDLVVTEGSFVLKSEFAKASLADEH